MESKDLTAEEMETLLTALTEAVAAINRALDGEAPAYRKTYLKGAAREVARTIGKE